MHHIPMGADCMTGLSPIPSPTANALGYHVQLLSTKPKEANSVAVSKDKKVYLTNLVSGQHFFQSILLSSHSTIFYPHQKVSLSLYNILSHPSLGGQDRGKVLPSFFPPPPVVMLVLKDGVMHFKM